MMTQGQLESIPVPFEQTMSELEMRIMSEIVRAIKTNGFSTSTADAQVRCLMQLGKSENEIKQAIQKALDVTDAEIERVFSDTVYEQYYGYSRAYEKQGIPQIPFEKNLKLQTLILAIKAQTKNTYRNITNSTGFAIRSPITGKIMHSPLMEFYQNTLTDAVMDIASGAVSYDKALSRAINTMTNSGLRWIDYESGAHFRVNVAARNAIMTGFRQVQGEINEQVAAELDTDSYEVSYHMGARPTHQTWQGRVYTYEELRTICGLGTVTGLHGVNCYHDYNAFIPGISVRTYTDEQLEQMIADENEPKVYNGKSYTTYEALQEQRRQETAMRKTRQDIKLLQEGGAGKDSITIKKAKYQGQMQQYKAFSNAMRLPEQMQRVYHDGIGKIVSYYSKSAKTNEESDIVNFVGDKLTKGLYSQKKSFKESLKNVKDNDLKTLLSQAFERVQFERSDRKNYFSINTVFLTKYADNTTIAHELFHEIDNTYQLVEQGFLKESVNKDYSRLCNLASGYGKSIENMLYSRYPEAFQIRNDKKILKQQYRGISDILNGMSDGEINLGAGHEKKYWRKGGKLQSETFSQYGRTFYSMDEETIKVFKELFPNSYMEISNTIKGMMK